MRTAGRKALSEAYFSAPDPHEARHLCKGLCKGWGEHTYRHEASPAPLPALETAISCSVGRQGQGLRPAVRSLTASVAGENNQPWSAAFCLSRRFLILLGFPVLPEEPFFESKWESWEVFQVRMR